MNVKHIFAFVICIVLPNGLFSEENWPSEEQHYYDQMVSLMGLM